MTNDPQSLAFDKDQPGGLSIVVDNLEELWPAFARIREDILKHASAK